MNFVGSLSNQHRNQSRNGVGLASARRSLNQSNFSLIHSCHLIENLNLAWIKTFWLGLYKILHTPIRSEARIVSDSPVLKWIWTTRNQRLVIWCKIGGQYLLGELAHELALSNGSELSKCRGQRIERIDVEAEPIIVIFSCQKVAGFCEICLQNRWESFTFSLRLNQSRENKRLFDEVQKLG